MYRVAHPLVRNFLLIVFGKFCRLSIVAYCQNRPSQLMKENITKYGECGDAQVCMYSAIRPAAVGLVVTRCFSRRGVRVINPILDRGLHPTLCGIPSVVIFCKGGGSVVLHLLCSQIGNWKWKQNKTSRLRGRHTVYKSLIK